MTALQAIQQATSILDRRDAETLLLHTLQRDRAWLRGHPEAELAAPQAAEFFANAAKRAQHWPLQYLTGRQEFYGLELEVSPDTLIPRPETELLVEGVLEWVAAQPAQKARPLRIVDVGTGTGAIAITLAHQLPSAQVWALDLSPAVQAVVEGNAQRHGVADRVRFALSDLLQALAPPQPEQGHGFDIVVSNPPYVALADAPTLQPEVRDFEPHMALFAGQDGLAIYRRLIPEAWNALRPGGLLAMEFGYGQQDALADLLASWQQVRFRRDYAGIVRMVFAERPCP